LRSTVLHTRATERHAHLVIVASIPAGMIVNNVHPEYRKPQVARGVEVAGAARNRTAEVRGSNPLGSTSEFNNLVR
jgi:hypothetical protein